MAKGDFSIEDYRLARSQALELEDSILWTMLITKWRTAMNTALTNLERPEATMDQVRVAQGARNAYKRAIMSLKDIQRLSAVRVPKRRSEVQDG